MKDHSEFLHTLKKGDNSFLNWGMDTVVFYLPKREEYGFVENLNYEVEQIVIIHYLPIVKLILIAG